jgi:phosphoglucomutase/phosphomannomutase
MKAVETGFDTLEINRKYKDAALQQISDWLTDISFSPYVPQIEHMIHTAQWEELLDAFFQVIPFGTGGRRGPVGIGPNRINPWTIQASAQGHCQYLLKRYGEAAASRGVVITYDVRRYKEEARYNPALPNPVRDLTCRELAVAAARVYAANGIKVFFFDDVRSTPELSFAVRHLKAVAGDMFSASHNPPSDNGKKVYDEFGGQLIPPYDQELVDEVTHHVRDIRSVDFEDAKRRGLIVPVGAHVDKAFIDGICMSSRSSRRDIRILYSPLHGTGLTSVYPALKSLGFDVTLDPATSILSGAFEHVTFNIPNPEVTQSFDGLYSEAENIGADLILNSDPDADRIGVMVRHHHQWRFLNGNEIGILLAEYGISKSSVNPADRVIIKTAVTTSMIDAIARQNGVRCIGDLLVGFKYIGGEMNRLEAENRMDGFILGGEESHGYLVGNYCRDKDAAGAAVWICELAAETKASGKTLVEFLDDVYARYGYCHNYLTEIRMLGAKGLEQRSMIMNHLRGRFPKAFGEFVVSRMIDRWKGDPQPHLSETDTSSRNVLIFHIENLPETRSIQVTVRPSGTEPKIKMYFEVMGHPFDVETEKRSKAVIVEIRGRLEKAFMNYCYRILGIDFPERGYLLFWQLNLDQKLKYFAVEPQIAALKKVPDMEIRKQKLNSLLEFLGTDPVKKVDSAFKAAYGVGIKEYLEVSGPDELHK